MLKDGARQIQKKKRKKMRLRKKKQNEEGNSVDKFQYGCSSKTIKSVILQTKFSYLNILLYRNTSHERSYPELSRPKR